MLLLKTAISTLGIEESDIVWDNGAAHSCNICHVSSLIARKALSRPAFKNALHKGCTTICEKVIPFVQTPWGKFDPSVCPGLVRD